MENVFEHYIKLETEKMARQPEVMKSNDYRYGHRFIIVRDEPKNIEKFNNLTKDANFPDDVTIYYNEPYYYDLIEDGVHTRAKIEKERKRQERLENPQIWKEVRDIESKDEFLDYLLEYWYYTNNGDIHEYSEDFEIDSKELKLTHSVLKNMKKSLQEENL